MSVPAPSKLDQLIEQLYNVPDNGKAEIINGEVVRTSPTSALPGRTGGKIYTSLSAYVEELEQGYAFPDNVGFLVNLPDRKPFSSDAAFFIGELTGGKFLDRFLEDASIFAVEARSEGNYGPAAERKIREKIADFFAAGTEVVWDVDVLCEETVHVYRASDPSSFTIYRRGDVAEAEPALPGWTIEVDKIFPKAR